MAEKIDNTKAFEIIKNVFTRSAAILTKENIQNELDWERHLYGYFKDEIGAETLKDYHHSVEFRASKTDSKKKLWITPHTYQKKKQLIDNYFHVKKDEAGHVLIELDKNYKELKSDIKTFLKSEKKRAYYVDMMLTKRSDLSRIFFIELKYGKNISAKIEEDYYKLKRTASVKNPKAIYIAVGYDSALKQIYGKATNEKYNFSINLNEYKHISASNNDKGIDLNEKTILSILKTTTKDIYEDYNYTNEATWSSEIMYHLNKISNSSWKTNSEINGIFENKRGSLDLGIYKNNTLKYGIELKGHYEPGTPNEIALNMSKNKNLEKDFLKKTREFLTEYKENKKIINQRSAFPRNDDSYYLKPDFFEKIVEIYYQCERLSNNNQLKKSYMVFIDHQDDLSFRKKKPLFSEKELNDNFLYRKKLILEILKPILKNCEFIYIYAININNKKKQIFLT